MKWHSEKAIAVKYETGMPAPFVLAKGVGYMADTIIRLAEKAGIPVLRQPDIAEKLFYLETGAFIPEECFEAVAQMLVYVHTISQRVK
ncbi:MAG: EscU/YscU/HrcU family type III secretion system export apparatus switch protein [Spirochaetales bacterium]|jgi:type III secretion system FlhB-like substrate exporter|nr:EscU/YscU/HrcU family type III secretion system export apparatus switch protein [Spirochaetales bacterium]